MSSLLRDPDLWSQVKCMAVDMVSESLWTKVKTAHDKFLYMVGFQYSIHEY